MTNPDPATPLRPDPRDVEAPLSPSEQAYADTRADPERRELGDVATAVVNGKRMIVQRTTAKQLSHAGGETVWVTPRPVAGSRREVTSSWLIDARPLLVLDPYSPDGQPDPQLAALASAFCHARWDHTGNGDECDPLTFSALETAARAVLDPPLAEPGLLAVVEAASDRSAARVRWCQLEQGRWSTPGRNVKWSRLIDPTLVRPGVEDPA